MAKLKRLIILIVTLMAVSLFGRVSAQAPDATQLTELEKRGKQIYFKGTSPSGKEIMAYLGSSSVEVPASTMACANCHGADGLGKREGGSAPSNLTWESLTKNYGVTHPGGRKHPPYTERALELAITRGIDPGGNRLQSVMPRYSMSREDMAGLIAYLKRVGKDFDPGITQASIKIGTFIPADGPLAESGEAVKAMLEAYFKELNDQGGIYNRKIEFLVARVSAKSAVDKLSVERFIKDEQVFAMVGAFMAGAEKELAAMMESEAVPMIGPFTLMPRAGFPLNRQVFYLLSGLSEQSRALVNFAAQKPDAKNPSAVVFPDTEMSAEIVEAIEDQSKKLGLSKPIKLKYERSKFDYQVIVQELMKARAGTIFFLGSAAEGALLLKEAARADLKPSLLMPGAFSGRDLFDAPLNFKDKIFVAFPTVPSSQPKPALMEMAALAEKHKLTAKHITAQISAYSAAKVLVEGLKLAGRDLSREKLITALEGLYELDTVLSPRISFGPNRRIGAMGAYVVAVDLEKKGFTPTSEWIKLD